MANTGSGENANASTQNPSTAASSTPSRRSDKTSTKRTRSSITPAEATELLTSALAYCKDAGLEVEGYNEEGSLVLFVVGVKYDNERIVLAT